MKKNIKIKYDGKYPCLCSGHLEVWVGNDYYDFGKYCLSSGGSCYFTDHYTDPVVEEGEWDITEFPKNFPMELKDDLLNVINMEIPYGCCGGCL